MASLVPRIPLTDGETPLAILRHVAEHSVLALHRRQQPLHSGSMPCGALGQAACGRTICNETSKIYAGLTRLIWKKRVE